jgi:hypothetical protein
MMNRKLLLALGVLFILALAWISLMGYINSRSTEVRVTVAGAVDEVTFYEASRPDEQVARIVTNGVDQQETIRLRNTTEYSLLRQMPPADYRFVTRQDDQTYTSSSVCCPVGLRSARVNLSIRGLSDWERTTE